MLLKKCMHDGKASFDAEWMEKSEQLGVSVDVLPDRIIIKSKTKRKKAKPKVSKEIPIQEYNSYPRINGASGVHHVRIG